MHVVRTQAHTHTHSIWVENKKRKKNTERINEQYSHKMKWTLFLYQITIHMYILLYTFICWDEFLVHVISVRIMNLPFHKCMSSSSFYLVLFDLFLLLFTSIHFVNILCVYKQLLFGRIAVAFMEIFSVFCLSHKFGLPLECRLNFTMNKKKTHEKNNNVNNIRPWKMFFWEAICMSGFQKNRTIIQFELDKMTMNVLRRKSKVYQQIGHENNNIVLFYWKQRVYFIRLMTMTTTTTPTTTFYICLFIYSFHLPFSSFHITSVTFHVCMYYIQILNICIVPSILKQCIKLTFEFDMAYDAFLIL